MCYIITNHFSQNQTEQSRYLKKKHLFENIFPGLQGRPPSPPPMRHWYHRLLDHYWSINTLIGVVNLLVNSSIHSSKLVVFVGLGGFAPCCSC